MLRLVIVSLMIIGLASGQSYPEHPLRMEAVENVTEDLEKFIPERISEEGVSGLSVALIRENRIVWNRGYGITNSITGAKVDTHTVFSVASLGKAVAGYLALKQLEEGRLSLDESLGVYDKSRWLPSTDGHDSITLRHLLTHTSGLSNFLRDQKKELKFLPGERFSYSGVGFMYLQEILKQLSGKSLDSLAREDVFEEFGMMDSWYGEPLYEPTSITRGHIAFERAIAPFSIIFLPVFIVLLAIAMAVGKLLYKSWKLGGLITLLCFVIAAIATFLFLKVKAGGIVMATYFSTIALVLVLIWALLVYGGRMIIKRFQTGHGTLNLVTTLWGVAIMVLLTTGLRDVHIPLVNWFDSEGNAASSLRSTSGDMARFLIGLSEKYMDGDEHIHDMFDSKIEVDEHVSWGLGIAIQRGKYGDNVWHWGSNPGSKSLMVLYPESKMGIVVLSNSHNASELITEIAARALGGKAYWDF